jgi:hypothetical protein
MAEGLTKRQNRRVRISRRAPGSVESGRPRRFRWIVDTLMRGITGLPLAVLAVPMSLAGSAGTAARLQVRMVARCPGTAKGFSGVSRRPDPTRARVVMHSALVAIPSALAFAAVAMQLFTVWSGYFYPLRPDTIAALDHPFTPDRQVLSEAWGGPTLMGAWAVHSCVAFGLQVILAALLVGLCRLQNSIAMVLTEPRADVPDPDSR